MIPFLENLFFVHPSNSFIVGKSCVESAEIAKPIPLQVKTGSLLGFLSGEAKDLIVNIMYLRFQQLWQ